MKTTKNVKHLMQVDFMKIATKVKQFQKPRRDNSPKNR